ASKGADDILNRQFRRARNAGVIRAEGMELMRIGRGDERLTETLSDLDCAPVRIQKASPKMAQLDGIEAVDFLDEFSADRTAENIERMRCDREERPAAATPQCGQVLERSKRLDLSAVDVQQNDVGAFEPHFRRRDQQNPYPRRIRENFGSIENRIVQRDCEDAKSQGSRALEQFVRGIVERVLRIVERMDMEIDLDPFFFSHPG